MIGNMVEICCVARIADVFSESGLTTKDWCVVRVIRVVNYGVGECNGCLCPRQSVRGERLTTRASRGTLETPRTSTTAAPTSPWRTPSR